MDPDTAELSAYVGASSPRDDAYVAACWGWASELVHRHIGVSDDGQITSNLVRRAILEVGSELFHRREAPNGIAQFATPDSTAVRVARDPMIGAYTILAPLVGPGVA